MSQETSHSAPDLKDLVDKLPFPCKAADLVHILDQYADKLEGLTAVLQVLFHEQARLLKHRNVSPKNPHAVAGVIDEIDRKWKAFCRRIPEGEAFVGVYMASVNAMVPATKALFRRLGRG